MYLMSPEVSVILSHSEDKSLLFNWLCEMGPTRWLAGQILLCGLNGVMPRN